MKLTLKSLITACLCAASWSMVPIINEIYIVQGVGGDHDIVEMVGVWSIFIAATCTAAAITIIWDW